MKEQSKNKVGLDIGSHSIKVAEISEGPGKLSLASFGMKIIASPTKESIASGIKALADESRLSTKDLNISISGSAVIVRFLSMPRMKDEDLRSAMKFEAEKFMPFNMSDCVVDFHILRKVTEENKLDILLAAAKKGYVEERIKLVEGAGFSVRVVDVDSFAIINSFLKNFPAPAEDKTFALLNIGATMTNLSILHNDSICFARDIATGGNDFNLAISKALNIDPASAEEVKLSPKDNLAALIACTKAAITTMLDELRLSFSYYENQCGRNVDEIYLSGGSSALAGLEDHLEEALGIRPKIWDPFQFLNKDSLAADINILDNVKNYFAVSVGLALR